jgi:hypothetical protein
MQVIKVERIEAHLYLVAPCGCTVEVDPAHVHHGMGAWGALLEHITNRTPCESFDPKAHENRTVKIEFGQ